MCMSVLLNVYPKDRNPIPNSQKSPSIDGALSFHPQHRDLQCIDRSERLNKHGEEQGQVFGSFDGKLVCGVIVDHFRDGLERRAVLTQNVAAVFVL